MDTVALVAVTGEDPRRVWNELLQLEYQHGAARHVGAQVRYLLVSNHGVLGALGFAASYLGLDAGRARRIYRLGRRPALSPAAPRAVSIQVPGRYS